MGIRVDEMRELAECLDPCVDRERLGCLGQQLSPDCQLLVTCQQKEPKKSRKNRPTKKEPKNSRKNEKGPKTNCLPRCLPSCSIGQSDWN